jgi:purine-nucleoside phosphorylase
MAELWPLFVQRCRELRPRSAVVLGSGLSDVADPIQAASVCPFYEVPGLVPPTVTGHRGQVAIGLWDQTPVVICSGRVHFYEGHSWERVTRMVHHLAALNVTNLLLTNAAGGIRNDLQPGTLMPIARHQPLLTQTDWQRWGNSPEPDTPYSGTPVLIESLAPGIVQEPGCYAALTGPSYETPAEIRALKSSGADAVGMSTAREAEAAAALGLRVAGVSIITNRASGLAPGVLSHQEVETNARLALVKLRQVLAVFVNLPS